MISDAREMLDRGIVIVPIWTDEGAVMGWGVSLKLAEGLSYNTATFSGEPGEPLTLEDAYREAMDWARAEYLGRATSAPRGGH